MILKVQISTMSNDGKKHVLIYSEDREIFHQEEATKDVIDLAKGRMKFFVEAEIVNTRIQIREEVPDQDW
jgi:hypothetical protein